MDEFIGRQRMKDMITNHWSDFSDATNYKTALACVDAVPTVTSEPHWIPCSERLPTKSDDYLVSSYDKLVFDLYYSVEYGWDGWWHNRISAWMPLPEPYKGVTE